MANSWSFLHDEMNMSNQDYWYEDGFSLTGNPGADSPDTINFGIPPSTTFGAEQVMDYLSLGGEDSVSFNLTMEEKNTQSKYKYSEDAILKELQDYITGTYNQHYSAGDDKIQTLDLIEACGDGESFCRSNILKYASRYDKKGTARRDIMKILHYAVLLMHFNDKNAQRETYPQ
jgi:hypothetical protein